SDSARTEEGPPKRILDKIGRWNDLKEQRRIGPQTLRGTIRRGPLPWWPLLRRRPAEISSPLERSLVSHRLGLVPRHMVVLIGFSPPFSESRWMGRVVVGPSTMALNRVLADGVVFRVVFDMPGQRAHYVLGWRTHHIANHPGMQFPDRIS